MGHDLILLKANSNSVIFWEGNAMTDGGGIVRINEYTYNDLKEKFKKYPYMAFIAWPKAPAFTPETVYPTSVTAADLTMKTGDSATLGYTPAPSNATQLNVTWSKASDPGNAITLSSTGEVTAVKTGTATVRVALATKEGGAVTADMTITVQNGTTGAVRVDTSKEFVVPDALHKLGSGKGLRATIVTSGATLSKIYGYTYKLDASGNTTGTVQSLSDSASGTSYVINSSNKINSGLAFNDTAKYPVGYYDYVLKATYIINKHSVTTEIHRSHFSVYSGTAAKVTGITLNPSALRVKVGDVITVTTAFTPASPSSKLLTHTVGNSAILSASETDVVAHKYSLSGKSAGTTTFTVAAQDGSGKTASISIEVYPKYVDSISLNKTTATMTGRKGTSLQLTPSYLPITCDNPGYTWTSSDATVATVSVNGFVSVASDIIGADRTVTITATANDGSGQKATCTVTVTAVSIPVTSVTLNKASLTLNTGATETLTATVDPSNATNKTILWTSSNSTVAAVGDTTGIVSAVGPGTATITAAAQDESGKKATCTVTVKQPVTIITLDPTAIRLKAGATCTVTATVLPSNATNKTLLWTSSKTSVATVNSVGTITAVSAGTAVITAAARDGSGVSATCNVTVYPSQVSSIAFSKDHYTVKGSIGSCVQLTLTYESSECDPPEYTFVSSDPSLLTVSENGLATVASNITDTDETITVTATANDGSNATAQTTIVLSPSVIYPVTISMTDSFVMYKGETAYPEVTLSPANTTVTTVTWSKNDPDNLINLYPNGRITRNGGNGTCTVTATAATATGTISATATVTLSRESGADTELQVANSSIPSGILTLGAPFSIGGILSTGGIINNYSTSISRNTGFSNLESGEQRIITISTAVNSSQTELSALNNRIDFSNESVFSAGHYNMYIRCSYTVNGVRKMRDLLNSTFNIAAGQPVLTQGIYVTPSTLKVKPGESQDISLMLHPENVSSSYLNISIEDPSVASVSVKNGSESAYTITGITEGITRLILKTDDGSGVLLRKRLAVYPAQVQEVTVTAGSNTIEGRLGNTLQMTASYLPITCDDPSYIWTSSDTTAATVDENGLVTITEIFMSGQKTVTITATAQDGSEAAGEFTLTILGYAELSGIEIQSATDTLEGTIGSTLHLTAAPVPAEAELPGVIWKSSDETIAYIDENGLVTIRTTIVNESRTVTITAEALNYPDFTDTVTLTVTPSSAIMASGMWGTCEWTISSDGVLRIGAGTGNGIPAWNGYSGSITRVAVTGRVLLPAYPENLFNGFNSCTDMDLSYFDTSNVSSMYGMFKNCSSLTKLDLSGFSTASVSRMDHMFENCSSLTGINLSSFDTANVTLMENMFKGCDKLTVLETDGFNTSNVTNMASMFEGCKSLTALNLSGWNTENVASMHSMFRQCHNLTSIQGLEQLDTSSLVFAPYMFAECQSINTLDLGGWHVIFEADGMGHMFYGMSGLTSLNIRGFDTSKVTDMSYLFAGCSKLSLLDVSGFDTSNVTNMEGMFNGLASALVLDVSSFNTSNATNMRSMFAGCASLYELNVSGFDTANVTDMSGMFQSCSSLFILDLSNFDMTKVTSIRSIVDNCSDLESIVITSDTPALTDMAGAFRRCPSLAGIDLSSLDTSSVSNMNALFQYDSNLLSVDLSTFDTSSLRYAGEMFEKCSKLQRADLRSFDTSGVDFNNGVAWVFYQCNSLVSLCVKAGAEWDLSFVATSDYWINGQGITAAKNEIGNYNTVDTTWRRANSVVIPSNVQKVLHLPSGLEAIEEEAFANMGLEVVYIPTSVTYVAWDAFSGNDGLYIVLSKNSPVLDWAIDYSAIHDCHVVIQ